MKFIVSNGGHGVVANLIPQIGNPLTGAEGQILSVPIDSFKVELSSYTGTELLVNETVTLCELPGSQAYIATMQKPAVAGIRAKTRWLGKIRAMYRVHDRHRGPPKLFLIVANIQYPSTVLGPTEVDIQSHRPDSVVATEIRSLATLKQSPRFPETTGALPAQARVAAGMSAEAGPATPDLHLPLWPQS